MRLINFFSFSLPFSCVIHFFAFILRSVCLACFYSQYFLLSFIFILVFLQFFLSKFAFFLLFSPLFPALFSLLPPSFFFPLPCTFFLHFLHLSSFTLPLSGLCATINNATKLGFFGAHFKVFVFALTSEI